MILEDKLKSLPQVSLGILSDLHHLLITETVTEVSGEAEIKLIEGGADVGGEATIHTCFKLTERLLQLVMRTLLCLES